MKFFCARVVFPVLFASLTIVIPPKLLASKGRDDREVYFASVQGDVRISSGKDHRPDLNQPWEQALAGELVQEGCALATGDGRAEIEFENGSTVYLAENSVLLFRELSAGKRGSGYSSASYSSGSHSSGSGSSGGGSSHSSGGGGWSSGSSSGSSGGGSRGRP
jgi:hypothetical protein